MDAFQKYLLPKRFKEYKNKILIVIFLSLVIYVQITSQIEASHMERATMDAYVPVTLTGFASHYKEFKLIRSRYRLTSHLGTLQLQIMINSCISLEGKWSFKHENAGAISFRFSGCPFQR